MIYFKIRHFYKFIYRDLRLKKITCFLKMAQTIQHNVFS